MNQNDADRMMQMITGYWVTQVVHADARVGGRTFDWGAAKQEYSFAAST